jgi:hypothetical protein
MTHSFILYEAEARVWVSQLVEDHAKFTSWWDPADESVVIEIILSQYDITTQKNRCRNAWHDIRNAMPGLSGNSCPEDYDG